MRLTLATENGRRVGRTSKAKRLAAEPATEAARLRRSLARIRVEAERAHVTAKHAEIILKGLFEAASACEGSGAPLLVRALAREALIECPQAHRFAWLARACEMAEEGTLCA